jgi:Xaa-Pro dipeptidase
MSAEHGEGELPFTQAEYDARIAKVREGMRKSSLDVLLVTGPENIYYLSGYHTTGYHVFQALILPATGQPCFVVRRLEIGNVRSHSWISDAVEIPDGQEPTRPVADWIAEHAGKTARVGYEHQAVFLPPSIYDSLKKALPEGEWVPASGLVEAARIIKSPAEIAYLRQASTAAAAAVKEAHAAARPGVTENDVAAAVYGGLVRAGSEYAGSPPYVTAGPQSAVGHATYAMNRIRTEDTIWVEVGASIKRYNAGIGRMIRVGPARPEFDHLHDLIQRSIDSMIAAVRPGAISGDVDAAGRSLVEAAGLGNTWLHRGGYSLGVSFPPGLGEGHIMDIKPGDSRVLEAGMVFHLVPIVLVPGFGAVGCTETVLVTKDGREILTDAPRLLTAG